jgi:hypothetical protein
MKAKVLHKTPKEESEFIETEFGTRKVSHINQSRMVAIPKMALQNVCGTTDNLTVKVSLVQNGKEKFLKLVPTCNTINEEDIDEKDDVEENEDV